MNAARRGIAIVMVSLLMGLSKRPWTEGVPVQQPQSGIELISVTSRARSDFDPYTRGPGPIFFDDCLAYVNTSLITVTHVQFIFVAVDDYGQPKREPLPLDIRGTIPAGVRQDGEDLCRYHVYPNRDRGYWLVAFVNTVEFADGRTWHAPDITQMTQTFSDALPGV